MVYSTETTENMRAGYLEIEDNRNATISVIGITSNIFLFLVLEFSH